MDKYILEYTSTKEDVASLDISVLESETIDIVPEELSLQLINGWIKDVTNANVTFTCVSLKRLRAGITQGIYFIKLYNMCDLRIQKTSHSLKIRELQNKEIDNIKLQ